MKGLNDVEVEKNYQVFVTLLMHFREVDVRVEAKGEQGITLGFNRGELEGKESEIQLL
jgi:hypothetical protein